MKKKLLSCLLAAAMTVSTASFGVSAATITEDSEPQSAQTEITTSVEPSYAVTIPQDIAVEFNALTTNFGAVSLDKAQLNPGYAVTVSLDASGTLKNSADETKTIAYAINAGETAFTSQAYTEAGQSTALSIVIVQEAWDAAPAGNYSDTVTFNISYGSGTMANP